jgi:SAM-dependent methyltransferase
VNAFKTGWLRWHLSRLRKGHSGALDSLYRWPDPWGLDVPEEHARFRETSRLIYQQFGGTLESILEIGCGEGLQTCYLSPLAQRIVAMDPSHRAIARAQSRGLPNVRFNVGDLRSCYGSRGEPFDLVTACEVLYYAEDPTAALRELESLACRCVVTYHAGQYKKLDPLFHEPERKQLTINTRSYEWRFVCWRTHLYLRAD